MVRISGMEEEATGINVIPIIKACQNSVANEKATADRIIPTSDTINNSLLDIPLSIRLVSF